MREISLVVLCRNELTAVKHNCTVTAPLILQYFFTLRARRQREAIFKLKSKIHDVSFFYGQTSPGQELQAHTHTHTTDDNDIRPHTIQEHNERTSTEFNLVTP